jgi:hypothetical protein
VTHFIDVTLVSRVTLVSGVTLVTYIIATCHWPSKVSFEAFLYPISIKSEGGVKKCFLMPTADSFAGGRRQKNIWSGPFDQKVSMGSEIITNFGTQCSHATSQLVRS